MRVSNILDMDLNLNILLAVKYIISMTIGFSCQFLLAMQSLIEDFDTFSPDPSVFI